MVHTTPRRNVNHGSMVNQGQQWLYHVQTMVDHGKLCCNHALTMINCRFVKWLLSLTKVFGLTMVEPMVDHGSTMVTVPIMVNHRFMKWHSTKVEPCFFHLGFINLFGLLPEDDSEDLVHFQENLQKE